MRRDGGGEFGYGDIVALQAFLVRLRHPPSHALYHPDLGVNQAGRPSSARPDTLGVNHNGAITLDAGHPVMLRSV